MRKLCTDQLIGKLVAILREFDQHTFDNAVEQAKNQLTIEAEVKQDKLDLEKLFKRNDLEKLFDSQITTLEDRGTPEQIVEILQNQKHTVIQKTLAVWEEKYPSKTLGQLINKGIHLMLPVIPLTFRSPHDLMAMVQSGGRVGYTYLNPTWISDVVEAPKEPYYISDVEDGRGALEKTHLEAEIEISNKQRCNHTVAEDLALVTHTSVLSHHFLFSIGSRYRSDDNRIPNICLDSDNGRPELYGNGNYIKNLADHWGLASCGSRL